MPESNGLWDGIKTGLRKLRKPHEPDTTVNLTTTNKDAPSDLPTTSGDEPTGYSTYPGMYGAMSQYYKDTIQLGRRREDLFREYDELDEECPAFTATCSILSDNATRPIRDHQHSVTVKTDIPRVRAILEDLLYERLRVDDILWLIARDVVKYGERAEEIVVRNIGTKARPEYQVDRLKPLPTQYIVPQYNAQGVLQSPAYHQIDPKKPAEPVAKLLEWQVVYFANFFSRRDIVGRSVGFAARKPFKILRLMEEAVTLGRLTRAHNRYVYAVDVTGLTPKDAQKHIDDVKKKLRKRRVIDPSTGRMDLTQNPLSVEEDLFIGVSKESKADIKVLQGDLTAGNIDDLAYFQQEILSALNIPKAYLQQTQDVKSRGIFTEQDIQFARQIRKLQGVLLRGLRHICDWELQLNGLTPTAAMYTLRLPTVSIVDELRHWQAMQLRELTLRMFKGTWWASDEWILSKFGDMEADEIAEMLKGQVKPDKYNGLYAPPKPTVTGAAAAIPSPAAGEAIELIAGKLAEMPQEDLDDFLDTVRPALGLA